MKIGILTFHWATNYGAVLQCYALQEYLRILGHEVEIINYKPRRYDFWFKYLKRPWLLRIIRKDLIVRQKEDKLASFRKEKLHLTKRYYSSLQLKKSELLYDVVISGSDQVLNPSFTLLGEEHPTSTYYLEPFHKSKRIGYAVSFGCDVYPEDALKYSKQWISSFDRIGTRENTGLCVLKQMEYCSHTEVVPDPTILLGGNLFDNISLEYIENSDYICVYMLRRHTYLDRDDVVYIDDYNNPLSMEKWISTIKCSKGLITNSYHGMIVALLNHVPFVVVADAKNMNNRFQTLLSRVGLSGHIVLDCSQYQSILDKTVDWDLVESQLAEYRKIGMNFLESIG